MYQLLRTFFASTKKPSFNRRGLQRTISGLDPQHIASGSYLYKNFIKHQQPRQQHMYFDSSWKKRIKTIKEKEIEKKTHHNGAQNEYIKNKKNVKN